jgi:hypothetical protein
MAKPADGRGGGVSRDIGVWTLAEKGEGAEEIVVIADLDVLPPEVIAGFMAALDRLHRAYGGAGLRIKNDAAYSSPA